MARGSGIGIFALIALFFLMSRGAGGDPTLPQVASSRNIVYQYQEAKEDPLARGKKTSFVSKKTGKISPGMYTKPFVRRKGVLKPTSKIFEVARRRGSEVVMR